MDRISMVIGTVLMALLLMTTPVAATAPVASQGGGPVQSETHRVNTGTGLSAPSHTVSLNDTDGNETSGKNTTTDSSTPCCGGGGPADRPVWKYDANYDAEINYSEAWDSYEDYLDDIVTWETYLNVSEAYDDNETVLYPDPDDDGMTIREEAIWSDHDGFFTKYSTNTDDDQFSDFADPRPSTEDIPPKSDVNYEDDLLDLNDGRLDITATDNSGLEEAEVRVIDTSGPYEKTYTRTGISGTSASFEVDASFENSYVFWINVTDINGNTQAVYIDVTDSGLGQIKKSVVTAAAVGSTTSLADGPSPVGVVVGAVAVTAIVGTAAYLKYKNYDEQKEKVSETSQSLLITGTVAEYSSLASSVESAVEKSSVVLTQGYAASTTDPAGGTLNRGYGDEYVQETSGLAYPYYAIQSVLSNEDHVDHIYQNGEKTVVIGDNPYMDPIAITITGGVIVSATGGQFIEDPRGKRIVIDRNDRHPVDGKNVDYDELRR